MDEIGHGGALSVIVVGHRAILTLCDHDDPGVGYEPALTVGLIAAYLPALRASRIEPMRAIGG
jgi:hypothetical protein